MKKEEFPIPKHLLRESPHEIFLHFLQEKYPILKGLTTELLTGVFKTKDYSMFKRHNENRILKPKHLERLKRSMSLIGWLPGSYVIIYPDGRVIEGHHRVTVAQEQNEWIHFIIVDEEVSNHVSLLNKDKEPWRSTDYIETYARKGYEHYQKLLDFIERHPYISASNCMRICVNSDLSTPSKIFENGEYKTKDMKVAEKWAQQLKELKPYLLRRDATPEGENTQLNSSFVRAFLYFAKDENFDFEEFMFKLKRKYPNGIIRQDGLPKSIELFSKIINSRGSYEKRN